MYSSFVRAFFIISLTTLGAKNTVTFLHSLKSTCGDIYGIYSIHIFWGVQMLKKKNTFRISVDIFLVDKRSSV